MQKNLTRVIRYSRLLEILETLNPNIKEIKIIKNSKVTESDVLPMSNNYFFYVGIFIYEVELRHNEDINEVIQIALNSVHTITNNFATVRKFDKYD